MSTSRKVKDAKDLNTNELIYFTGHAKATYMSDGSTVEDSVSKKQDIISDLDAIRNGASKGATALQSYTEQYKGTVTGVKINGSSKSPSNGIVDIGTVITSHQDISGKQDKLVSGTNIKTINGESILGSGNITISGGSSSGSNGGSNGAYAEVSHGTSDTTFTLTPNTFHVWDEVSSLTLTLGEETVGVANEYLFQFTSGTEPTALTLPDSIVWVDDETPVIESGYIYQVSVLKGFATSMKFKNKSNLIINSFTIKEESLTTSIIFDYPIASYLTIKYSTDFGGIIERQLNPYTQTEMLADGPDAEGLMFISITPEQDGIYKYVYNG